MTIPKHILIVDDDVTVLESLGGVLRGEGYRVSLAGSGAEALRQFEQRSPDLVLLDINMPGMDGWTTFQAMEKAKPLLPVIVLTARPNQYPSANRLGIDAFMEKPLDLPCLLEAIDRLLQETLAEKIRRLTCQNFATAHLETSPA